MIFKVHFWDRGFFYGHHYVEAEDDLTALQLCAAVLPPDYMVTDVEAEEV